MVEQSRYSGEVIANVGFIKLERPDLARAIDHALLGGESKKGPTPRFKEVVRLARQGVWRPIENLLAHPYYQLADAKNPEDELANTRAIFYELARADLLFLEEVGDGEEALSVQTFLDKAKTFEDMLEVFSGITFLAARCRLQQVITDLMMTGHYVPFVPARVGLLYQDFITAENTADLAVVKAQVECIQGDIQAFQRTLNSFGN